MGGSEVLWFDLCYDNPSYFAKAKHSEMQKGCTRLRWKYNYFVSAVIRKRLTGDRREYFKSALIMNSEQLCILACKNYAKLFCHFLCSSLFVEQQIFSLAQIHWCFEVRVLTNQLVKSSHKQNSFMTGNWRTHRKSPCLNKSEYLRLISQDRKSRLGFPPSTSSSFAFSSSSHSNAS